jgi:prevent-host-death family protein
MRTVMASEFKAKCLKLMDQVARSGEPILITKKGKPVSRLEPAGGIGNRRRAAAGLASSAEAARRAPLVIHL